MFNIERLKLECFLHLAWLAAPRLGKSANLLHSESPGFAFEFEV